MRFNAPWSDKGILVLSYFSPTLVPMPDVTYVLLVSYQRQWDKLVAYVGLCLTFSCYQNEHTLGDKYALLAMTSKQTGPI